MVEAVRYFGLLSGIKVPAMQLILSQILLAFPFFIYMVVSKKNFATTLRLKKIGIVDILLCIIFYIAIYQVASLMNLISLFFDNNVIVGSMRSVSEAVPLPIGILLMAFLPAVLEESVYRGIIYGTYSNIGIYTGAVLSALIFGIMHGNLNQFSYAFVVGIALALLCEAADSLFASIFVHFTVNLVSTLMLYFYDEIAGFLESFGVNIADREAELSTGALLEMLPKSLLKAMVGALVAAFILYRIAARHKRTYIFTPKKKRVRGIERAYDDI